MKKHCFFVMILLITSGNCMAAGDTVEGYHFEADASNKTVLQRGARIFVNYCMGCHSASYMRYNRLGSDLGISEKILQKNLMFSTTKSGDTMEIAMRKNDALEFFGVTPPDLSVIARSRGADWLYAYFMTFYIDPNRPFGVNNLQFNDVAMPHVLWERQGVQKPVYTTRVLDDGTEVEEISGLELVEPGIEKPEEYKRTVSDLVNFLIYMSEPAKFQRQRIGIWVIIYLFIFLIIAIALKKEYWKDIH